MFVGEVVWVGEGDSVAKREEIEVEMGDMVKLGSKSAVGSKV